MWDSVTHATLCSDTPFLLQVAPPEAARSAAFACPTGEGGPGPGLDLLQRTAGAEIALESDRDRFPALRRLDDAHRDRLTFSETRDAGGAETRAMDKHVPAEIVAGDEAEP